jgi:hypothetical protein
VILLRQRQNEIRSGAKEEPISPQIILDFIHGSLDALSNSAKPEAVTLIIQRLRYHQAALPSREEWISALVVEIAQIAADQIQVESGPGNRDTRSARLLQLIRDPALGIDLDQIDALRESLDQADPE